MRDYLCADYDSDDEGGYTDNPKAASRGFPDECQSEYAQKKRGWHQYLYEHGPKEYQKGFFDEVHGWHNQP